MPDSPPRWLTTAQAAEYVGCSTSQIDRWRRMGKLIPSKPSGPHGPCWYKPSDLDQLMEKSRV